MSAPEERRMWLTWRPPAGMVVEEIQTTVGGERISLGPGLLTRVKVSEVLGLSAWIEGHFGGHVLPLSGSSIPKENKP